MSSFKEATQMNCSFRLVLVLLEESKLKGSATDEKPVVWICADLCQPIGLWCLVRLFDSLPWSALGKHRAGAITEILLLSVGSSELSLGESRRDFPERGPMLRRLKPFTVLRSMLARFWTKELRPSEGGFPPFLPCFPMALYLLSQVRGASAERHYALVNGSRDLRDHFSSENKTNKRALAISPQVKFDHDQYPAKHMNRWP